jgi:hypothetical protein
MNYKIIPGQGFDFLKIGNTTEQLKAILGEPDEIEKLEDEFFEDENEAIWHYNNHYIYPIVDMEKQVIISILCDHQDLCLGNAQLMQMDTLALRKHLKSYGIKEMGNEEDCIECFQAGINFMIEDEKIDLVDIYQPEK